MIKTKLIAMEIQLIDKYGKNTPKLCVFYAPDPVCAEVLTWHAELNFAEVNCAGHGI